MAKHEGFGRLLEVEMWKKWTPLWREAHFQVKLYKTPQVRTTFGSWDVEKVRAVVARSTFWGKMLKLPHVRATSGQCDVEKVHAVVAPSTFWWKMLKLPHVRATFWRSDRPSMSKKCTPLWREAHLEVKSVKNCGFWATFDVSDVVLLTDRWISKK